MLLAAVGYLIADNPAVAASLSWNASAGAGASVCGTQGGPPGTTSVPFSCTASSGGGEAASVYAAADYGLLRTSASASLPGAFGQGSATAEALVSFSDGLSITNAPVVGYIDVFVTTEGLTSVACGSNNCNPTETRISGYGSGGSGNIAANGYLQPPAAVPDGTTTYDLRIPYDFTAFGSAYSGIATALFSLTLDSKAGCGSGVPYSPCSAVTDFSHTAFVSEVALSNSSGQLVAGTTIQSDSGTNYNGIVPTPVPAPAMAWPLAGSMLGMLFRRRLRR